MNWLSDTAIERLREQADLPDLGSEKYLMLHKLGSGGMGTVYLAQDVDLGRKVAVKVMNLADPTGGLAARMTREARIVAMLEHPSIVPIHDVGTLPDGRVFYAMKLVQGKRLDEFARGESSLPDLLRIFQKICEAVAFAHARGVIHRDLKPENVMVGRFGEVLVMDWGVAKLMDGVQQSAPAEETAGELRALVDADLVATLPLAGGESGDTSGGTIIGTPAYMSPEQALGKTEILDQRSDVYSLGAVLFFLLTGRPPVEPANHKRGPRPRQIETRIPRALEAIPLKAMAPVPDDRYENAEQLSSDIVKFLDGEPVSAYPENVFEKLSRWLGKHRFIVWLILAYLLMRLIVFFVVGR